MTTSNLQLSQAAAECIEPSTTIDTGIRTVKSLIDILLTKDQDVVIEYIVVETNGKLVCVSVGKTPSHMLKFVQWAKKTFEFGEQS